MCLPPQQYGLNGATTIPYQLRYVFEVLTPHAPVSGKVTLFGNRVFAEGISLCLVV